MEFITGIIVAVFFLVLLIIAVPILLGLVHGGLKASQNKRIMADIAHGDFNPLFNPYDRPRQLPEHLEEALEKARYDAEVLWLKGKAMLPYWVQKTRRGVGYESTQKAPFSGAYGSFQSRIAKGALRMGMSPRQVEKWITTSNDMRLFLTFCAVLERDYKLDFYMQMEVLQTYVEYWVLDHNMDNLREKPIIAATV